MTQHQKSWTSVIVIRRMCAQCGHEFWFAARLHLKIPTEDVTMSPLGWPGASMVFLLVTPKAQSHSWLVGESHRRINSGCSRPDRQTCLGFLHLRVCQFGSCGSCDLGRPCPMTSWHQYICQGERQGCNQEGHCRLAFICSSFIDNLVRFLTYNPNNYITIDSFPWLTHSLKAYFNKWLRLENLHTVSGQKKKFEKPNGKKIFNNPCHSL